MQLKIKKSHNTYAGTELQTKLHHSVIQSNSNYQSKCTANVDTAN